VSCVARLSAGGTRPPAKPGNVGLHGRWVTTQQMGRPTVTAFISMYAEHGRDFGRPTGTARRIAMPNADDDAAKADAQMLVDELRNPVYMHGMRRRRIACYSLCESFW
jgi:hypothetical protein